MKTPLLLALQKWLGRYSCGKELKQLDVNLDLIDKWGNRDMRLHWWTQEWIHTSKLVSCYADNCGEKVSHSGVRGNLGSLQPGFHIVWAGISSFPALLISNKCHGCSRHYTLQMLRKQDISLKMRRAETDREVNKSACCRVSVWFSVKCKMHFLLKKYQLFQ